MKLSFQTWIHRLKLVLIRFPFTLIFLVGLSVLCFLSIQKVNVEIKESLWVFFALGILLNVAVTLCLEEFKQQNSRILLNVISSVLLTIYCFTLPEKLQAYQHYQLIALGLVFILSAFFVSFFNKDNEIPFWNFCKESIIQLVISGVFSLVLFGGLSLAVLSLDKLFGIHVSPKVYSDLSIVSFVLFAPIYFLSNVPDEIEKRSQQVSFDKIIKIFGLYILLPILAIYTLILYVYLIQIIFNWQLPNGWVSTLVSVLAMGGFLCLLILYPLYVSNENKTVDRFLRLFPVLLFPLLILMSTGIARRIADYDLTINRLYVLILNTWFYGISIYLFVSKAKHVKWIVISFATVAFLSSVGPWSVFSLTRKSLATQLEQQLTQARLMKDGKIVTDQKSIQKPDVLTQEKVVETVQYMVKTYGSESLQPYFSVSMRNKSAFDVLALMKMEASSVGANRYFYLHLSNDSFIFDTGSYPMLVMLNTTGDEKNPTEKKTVCENSQLRVDLLNDNLIVTNKLKNNSTFTIALRNKIQELLKEKRRNEKELFDIGKMTIKGLNYTLIIRTANGKQDNSKGMLLLSNFNACLFLRLDR